MTDRCNKAGVRIFVDVVLNHMTNQQYTSMSNSKYSVCKREYYDIGYNKNHFHNSCPLNNYQNAWEVKFCELFGLPDLKTEDDFVRGRLIGFLNKLIDLGASGFRVDTGQYIR